MNKEPIVYIVERAFSNRNIETQLKCLHLMKNFAKVGGKDREIQTLLKDPESGDFSGIMFTNTLKASHPISLISLGFFGPYNKVEANYNVSILIEEDKNLVKLYQEKFSNVKAEMGKIFFVNFDRPVILNSCKWYNIKFQLDGPKTEICERTSRQTFCRIDAGSHFENDIFFDFYMGSRQMPILKFSLLDLE